MTDPPHAEDAPGLGGDTLSNNQPESGGPGTSDLNNSALEDVQAKGAVTEAPGDPQVEAAEGAPEEPQVEEGAAEGAEEPKLLSPEEAQLRAQELQRRLREKRQKEEKERDWQRERNRIESTKMAADALKQIEEASRKRDVDAALREKNELEDAKAKLKEQLKRDWEEKFGKPYPEEEYNKPKNPKEQIARALNSLAQSDAPREAKITCLTKLQRVFSNAAQNSSDPKYLRLKKDNNLVQTQILSVPGALEALNAVGYADNGDILAIPGNADVFILNNAVAFTRVLITKLQST